MGSVVYRRPSKTSKDPPGSSSLDRRSTKPLRCQRTYLRDLRDSVPPNVTQILPGLARFTVPFPEEPRRNVNSFVFTAGADALLLDASWDVPDAREGLQAALALSGLKPASVSLVAITHLHPDHIGLAGRLRRHGAR